MSDMAPTRSRAGWIVAMVVVVALGGSYLWWSAAGPVAGGTVGAAAPGDLRFVDMADGAGRIESVDVADPDGARSGTALRCLRFYSAAGVSVCLRVAGPGPTYEAAVLDADGQVLRTVALPGVPSRARVSASGDVVSWTSFVSGDSYSVPGGFSTRSGVLDLRTGAVVESLEGFTAEVEGAPMEAIDVNYWGITVAADDRTFYATLASGGRTWLVQGDLVSRSVRALRRDAECPSLSPDGSSIAYKKRIGRFGPWDLAVLDLATGRELRLPGTAGIDDQPEWLDDTTLAYGAVPIGGRVPAIHSVAADGASPATLLVADASSPSVVR